MDCLKDDRTLNLPKKKTKEMGATDEKWTEMSEGEIHWPHFRNYEIILKL